jgi:hypothetical protein
LQQKWCIDGQTFRLPHAQKSNISSYSFLDAEVRRRLAHDEEKPVARTAAASVFVHRALAFTAENSSVRAGLGGGLPGGR